MKINVVARYVGIVLLLNALFMFISAGVSAYYDFDKSFSSLLLGGIITTIVGLFPIVFVRKMVDISVREGFLIVVFCWLLRFLVLQ